MSEELVFKSLQWGSAGILLVVLYFVGKIAYLFVDAMLKSNSLLITSLVDSQKQIVPELDKVATQLEGLAKAQAATETAIEESRKESAERHQLLLEGIRRAGGFVPSQKDMPAVRPERKGSPSPGGYRGPDR